MITTIQLKTSRETIHHCETHNIPQVSGHHDHDDEYFGYKAFQHKNKTKL